MATLVRQLSFDFEKPQNVFSAMLPVNARVLGGDMFGKAPVLWVLADWDLETEKRWFLYTICNTSIDEIRDPLSIRESYLSATQLIHCGHFMQVDNTKFPPVIPWNVFEIQKNRTPW